jgi:hypothetical protein
MGDTNDKRRKANVCAIENLISARKSVDIEVYLTEKDELRDANNRVFRRRSHVPYLDAAAGANEA